MKLTGTEGEKLRLPKSFYDRPLTPKEAQFATDNINIVWWYLDQQGFDRAEWFDVVIFRYLLTVKRWFALPELQQVKFVTLACNAMRSAISHEREKRAKEPRTVSLYDPIPGTDDLLYIDTIMCFTYDTPKEAKSKLSTISSHKRKYNATHAKGYDAYRVEACIYIIRAAGTGKGK